MLRNAFGSLALDSTIAAARDLLAAIRDRLPPALHADGGLLAHLTNPGVTDTQLRASRLPVDGSGVTQPVSAAALPLPAGAARDATLTDGTQRVGGTVAVSAAALPLPAGAASEGKLEAVRVLAAAIGTEATLSALSGKVGTPAADDLLSLLRSIVANTGTETTTVGQLKLTADQVQLNTDTLEAVLGTVSARVGTTGVAGSVAALLDAIRLLLAGTLVVGLPAGASRDLTLTDGSQRVGGTVTAALTGALPAGANTIGTVDLAVASPTAIIDTATAAVTKYIGVTVAETTGVATAKIRVRNQNAAGAILDTITLQPNESVSYTYPRGRAVASGTLYVQVVSGAVEGSVFAV